MRTRTMLAASVGAALVLISCGGNGKDPKASVSSEVVGQTTEMSFENDTYDFGVIKQGQKAEHVFVFTNTGDHELVIANAKGSCGCTVPEWPTEPIKPGESGEVKVVFDSSGKSGRQEKKVTITANTDPITTELTIKGEIETPENAS
jgi:hypothetical protein